MLECPVDRAYLELFQICCDGDAAMFIQTEATPNPATLKFLPGREVLAQGTADFPDAEQARQS